MEENAVGHLKLLVFNNSNTEINKVINVFFYKISECISVQCRMACSKGFKRDKNGCEYFCTCAEHGDEYDNFFPNIKMLIS